MTSPRPASARADVYSSVTSRIVADLEKGVRSWQKPWDAEHPAGSITRPLRHSGIPYRGMNVLLLWGEALAQGYNAPIWMTYKQAAELGAHVRRGERGSLVVFADRFTTTETDDAGQAIEREIPFMKGYTVFNVEQIEGLPAHYYAKAEPREPIARIEQAEAFFAATGAAITHGGNRACYSPGLDQVRMPPRDSFRDAESYCATLAHELTHWTSHPSRCARELGKRFGDSAYAAEELIAEMGSAFLCADLGLTPEVREDHAQYLGHWLGILKADKRAIFTAAAQAQRAADYLHGLQPKPEAKPSPPAPARPATLRPVPDFVLT
ncbi:MAG: zincin-like metallopeptidase domain-containing protein [Candidatus Accumulibacter sp.]|uniref:ArdC family protein n=1 Tax=Accumulibacter sp. TaxID=2053492 RepID=UPI0025D13B20|nr:zincin-like metallopeptidase domain-containing protein [Accumulibacter sp.]MCM8597584.1 zincin-like metallopeptidase domain-containing protein [Accumulibacter sp.]